MHERTAGDGLQTELIAKDTKDCRDHKDSVSLWSLQSLVPFEVSPRPPER